MWITWPCLSSVHVFGQIFKIIFTSNFSYTGSELDYTETYFYPIQMKNPNVVMKEMLQVWFNVSDIKAYIAGLPPGNDKIRWTLFTAEKIVPQKTK